MSAKLRLVKVVTQAHFVLDDGETLKEVSTQPVEVAAADWEAFPTGQFKEAAEKLEAQIQGSELAP